METNTLSAPAELAAAGVQTPPEPIAITGVGCRFPGGATDARSFWKILLDGKDAISEAPPDRWNADKFYDPDPTRPLRAVTRWGGFVAQPIDLFDAEFFGMSPREAAALDPMHRWLLEVAWEALQDAGEVPEALAGSRTGVFIGVFTEDMKLLHFTDSNREWIGPYTATGNAMTMASNRLSYWFDFRGPSMSVDTACSSSLTAVHLACQSLWAGESALALAGGANAMFRPDFTIAESRAGMLSPDGRSKAFDARANGYVRGEGAGIVVLKPLSRALADHDRIYATVRSTAANQDGRSKSITVPNGEAQMTLLREVCARAGVLPGQIGYVEAHGTGTPVGDPVEANALGTVLAVGRPEGRRCFVGSVKTNIGHLEAAAGVAGLIKAALCLHHRRIPPHLHFQNANPAIPFNQLCLRIPTAVEPWPDDARPALAAVNSFGFGGANALAILGEAPAPETDARLRRGAGRSELLPISAQNPQALAQLAQAYRELLTDDARAASLEDVVHCAAVRQTHHHCRAAIVGGSKEEMAGNIEAFLAGAAHAPVQSAQAPRGRLAWIFSGMGPQWWGMGRRLLEEEPAFREVIEECDLYLRAYTQEWSLMEEMSRPESASRMGRTSISQPANFALQAGVAATLRSWGLQPDVIVGHSAGEAAALYVAGAVTLAEAVKIIYHRSRLQDRTTGQGKMLAVGLSEQEALDFVREQQDARQSADEAVSVAAINGPKSITLVGSPDLLQRMAAALGKKDVFARFLKVDVPFHSHYMEPLKQEVFDSLKDLALCPAAIPLISTVTGAATDGATCDADYWWKNIRWPVRFADAMDSLLRDGCTTFLEIAPHPVLSDSMRQCASHRGVEARIIPTLNRNRADERSALLEAVGSLYVSGFAPDWRKMHSGECAMVDLPLYPWQRQSHWIESQASRDERLKGPEHVLLGYAKASACPSWQSAVDGKSRCIEDHRIQGAVVYPGAAYVEMGVAALRRTLSGDEPFELRDIRFEKALFLPENAHFVVETALHPEKLSFEIHSRRLQSDSPWTRHAQGRVGRLPGLAPRGEKNLNALLDRLTGNGLPPEECYRLLRERGFQYGPAFRGLTEFHRKGREALARVRLPECAAAWGETCYVHPSLLDSCFHALLLTAYADDRLRSPYLPVVIGSMTVLDRLPREFLAHTILTAVDERAIEGRVEVLDADGRTILELNDIRAVSPEADQGISEEAYRRLFGHLRWEELAGASQPEPAAKPASGPWILLSDKTGVAESVAAQLRSAGRPCQQVEPGNEYRQSDDGARITLDPNRIDHWRRLFTAAAARDCPRIVHLWSLDAVLPEDCDAKLMMEAQDAGPISLLPMLRAARAAPWQRTPQLWIVTRGTQVTGAGERPTGIAQSPMWGFTRTLLNQEYPELAGGVIDLPPVMEPGEAGLLCRVLSRPPAGETQLALRGRAQLVPRLYPAPETPRTDHGPRFPDNAMYLITGGFGGLGLLCARWMVERGARHLALLSRTPLPPRSSWAGVIDAATAARIEAVRSLERLGAAIHAASVDVTDEAALSDWWSAFRQVTALPLRGVLHAAGVPDAHMLNVMEVRDFLRVTAPKIAGAWALHRALKEEPLDFFVLFSSIAAYGVSLGMAHYAAGNSFLDTLAHYRRAEGLPAISVSWGAWAQAGMASQGDTAESLRYRGFTPMAPEMGLRALGSALVSNPANPWISLTDWPLVERRSFATGAPPMFAPMLADHPETAAPPQEDATASGVARFPAVFHALPDNASRTAALEDHVAAAAAQALRLPLDRLPREASLVSLGLDSLLALEFRNAIHARIEAGPSLVEILNGSSVASLARSLLTAIPAPEPDDIRDLADQLGALGEEEAKALLAALQA